MRKAAVIGGSFSWGAARGRLRLQIDLECGDAFVLFRIGDDREWKPTPFKSKMFWRDGEADSSLALRTVHKWLSDVAQSEKKDELNRQ
jgi:hypothetical protein